MIIKINGTNYPITLPCQRVKEREGGLDTATVDIRHIERWEPFEPFSPVEFDGDTWVIVSDQVTYERMVNRYSHSVSLCEEAKLLEKSICGAKTFSIPKSGEFYDTETALPSKKVITYKKQTGDPEVESETEYPQSYWSNVNHIYQTPSGGETFHVEPYNIVFPGASFTANHTFSVEYTVANGDTLVSSGTINNYTDGADISSIPYGSIVTLKYTEIYSHSVSGYLLREDNIYTFTVKTVNSADIPKRLPLTVFEAANRLLYTYEAHTMGETPLYVLNGYHDEWIAGDMILGAGDDIPCPELSFANGATLKEDLDVFASILHAKTRMRNRVIYFERLTKAEQSFLPPTYIDGADSFTSEKYGGEVQTFAQNVVNYNDGAGTASNLFAKTLRAEEGTVRIGEDGGIISTEHPIEKIVKVTFVTTATDDSGAVVETSKDITDKVVESTYYNTLSGYAGTRSKAQFLHYTQGQKGIKGLFYKAESLMSGTGLDKYAVQNVTGASTDYRNLLFRVTYIAICEIRACTPRPDGKGYGTSFALNQSESRTDANRLGRKMHATAIQLTSNSPQRTYIVPRGGALPEVGKQFDKDNYISQMSVEHLPTYTKATINISENYNKLSDYVAVSQAIRQYEIDVNNVQERHILYKDWCIIGFSISGATETDDNRCGIAKAKRQTLIITPFAGVDTIDRRVTTAVSTTYSASETERGVCKLTATPGAIKSCILPALSVGLGNSLLFAFRYADNFSAGSRAEPVGDIKEYNEQRYVTYADSYGNADLIEFRLLNGGTTSDPTTSGQALPELSPEMSVNAMQVAISGGEKQAVSAYGQMGCKVHLYKDPRETIIVEYQLLFGSDDGIIVGVDYCETNPLVCKATERATSWLCFYDHYIDPIQGSTEVPENAAYKCRVNAGDGYLTPQSGFSLPSHKAWAIVREGKFLLGQNAAWGMEETDGVSSPKKLLFKFCHRRYI